MKNIRVVGLIALALVAFGVTGATASAHEFKASKTGTLKDVGVGTHTFKVTAGNVECKTVKSTGKVNTLITKVQTEKVTYTNCKAFGTAATVSEAEYEFNAEESVSLKNTVIVESKVGGCSVIVAPTGNSNLKTVKYKNNGSKITVTAEVKGISYSVKNPGTEETVCGKTGETGTNGTYSGVAEVELEGGTIEWK